MSIENLIKILGATLLNTPSITKIDSIENDLSKVKNKTLFIAKNQADADIAIELGAYAILCDFDAKISDEEIAWLFVDDIELSIKKLIRFRLIDLKIDALYTPDVEFEILHTIVDDERIIYLDNNIFENYKKVQNIYKDSILISEDKKLLEDIYPKFKRLDELDINDKDIDLHIVKKSLFITTLIYKNRYHETLHISELFLKELKNSLKVINYLNLEHDIVNIHPKKHFHPIFISDNLIIKSFGQTQRVLVVEEDIELFYEELRYLKEHIKWARITSIEPKENILNELLKIEVKKFNIILIKANYNEVIKSLKEHSTKEAPPLFME